MIGAFIITFVIFILFLVFAISLSKGKGAFLLAGYNTMSKREKEKYDEMAMCKFMAKIMYGISFSMLLYALSALLEIEVLSTIGLILLLALVLFAVVYANTKNRFKKKGV